jgi:hypothetical protein
VLGGVLVSGCGSAVPVANQPAPSGSVSPGAAGAALCADIPHPTSLTVRRLNEFPENNERFAFPARVKVGDPVKVRAVAKALCALPRPPRDVARYFCAIDLGISYRLTFAAEHRRYSPVSVKPGDCEEVSGLTSPRWAERSPGFWRVLGCAMGITNATPAVFNGLAD